MNNTIFVVIVLTRTLLLGNLALVNAQLKDTYKFPRARTEEGFKIIDPIQCGIGQEIEYGRCINPAIILW
jgi:hypothetical protein